MKKELTANDGTKNVYIDLFGGEPFLEFKLLKDIVSYVWDNDWPKKRLCFATTNGTVLNTESKNWLRENKSKIWCGLSLDGTREMHNKNRSNSFDSIDMEFFRNLWPEQGVKMTVSDKTIETLAEGIIFAHHQGFKVSVNLAYGIDWANERFKTILARELNKLIDFYLKNPNIKPCSMLDRPIFKIGAMNPDDDIMKWCGTGSHMHTYDTFGNVYPCQMYMPLSMGIEKSDNSKSFVVPTSIPVNQIDEKCQRCILRKACPTCYGMNYIQFGDVYHKDEGLCELTKIMFIAASYLEYQRFEKGMLTLEDKEKFYLLKGIQRIQTELVI